MPNRNVIKGTKHHGFNHGEPQNTDSVVSGANNPHPSVPSAVSVTFCNFLQLFSGFLGRPRDTFFRIGHKDTHRPESRGGIMAY
ncbi:MAG: hypothetical protein LBG27_13250, partial [Spirochaetaceae bacterium]|nr:hypothetical protein [Spirochaetaceae bacterium]